MEYLARLDCQYCGQDTGTCGCGWDGEGAPWASSDAEDDYSEESYA